MSNLRELTKDIYGTWSVTCVHEGGNYWELWNGDGVCVATIGHEEGNIIKAICALLNAHNELCDIVETVQLAEWEQYEGSQDYHYRDYGEIANAMTALQTKLNSLKWGYNG